MISQLRAIFAFLIVSFAGTNALSQTSQWRPVSGNRRDNISGMALVEHSDRGTLFIVVNDNKKKEHNHAGLLTVEGSAAPRYRALKWLGDDVPTDLEAIASVPGTANGFMSLTAAGRMFRIELDRQNNAVRVLKSFNVPAIPAGGDFEAFALQKVGGSLLAVWADRGLDQKPAQLFWSIFDLQTYAFSQVGSAKVKVPYPVENTRHISDVRVDSSGAVFIASASDPGDDGPFASAVYYAGTFNLCPPQQVSYVQSPQPVRIFRFDYHKVEALEFVPGANGGFAFGTDDENLGTAIRIDWE